MADTYSMNTTGVLFQFVVERTDVSGEDVEVNFDGASSIVSNPAVKFKKPDGTIVTITDGVTTYDGTPHEEDDYVQYVIYDKNFLNQTGTWLAWCRWTENAGTATEAIREPYDRILFHVV